MYKGLLAVIVAAGCAAVFVGFVPPPVPALAAVQTPQGDVTVAVIPETLTRGIDARGAACAQPWPYYEPSCLRDSRRQDGRAPIVRIIAVGKPAADRLRKAQR